MTNLKQRIKKIECARYVPENHKLYSMVCLFADRQGKPRPKKSNDINETMKQIAEVLPS